MARPSWSRKVAQKPQISSRRRNPVTKNQNQLQFLINKCMNKFCSKCNLEKSIDAFYKCTLSRKKSWCKSCININNKKNHYEKYRLKNILSNCRLRARIKGLEYNLKESDIIIPEKCPVLGIPLVPFTGTGLKSAPGSPSIDRIDNKIGYIPSNIIVVSNRANRLKSDATLEELKKIASFYSSIEICK
jgi:hypothetical protein